jgi:hypothetical protein
VVHQANIILEDLWLPSLETFVFNPTSWSMDHVLLTLPAANVKALSPLHVQVSADQQTARVLVSSIEPMSGRTLSSDMLVNPSTSVTGYSNSSIDVLVEQNDGFLISNGILKIHFDSHGRLISLVDIPLGYIFGY